MPHPINVIHYLNPILLVLPTLSLISGPPTPPPELPGIRAVVTKHVIPRCTLILSLISMLAASYLVDGLTFAINVVINHEWNGDVPLGRGGKLGIDQSGWAWVVYT